MYNSGTYLDLDLDLLQVSTSFVSGVSRNSSQLLKPCNLSLEFQTTQLKIKPYWAWALRLAVPRSKCCDFNSTLQAVVAEMREANVRLSIELESRCCGCASCEHIIIQNLTNVGRTLYYICRSLGHAGYVNHNPGKQLKLLKRLLPTSSSAEAVIGPKLASGLGGCRCDAWTHDSLSGFVIVPGSVCSCSRLAHVRECRQGCFFLRRLRCLTYG